MHGNFRIAGAYDRLFLRSEQSLVLSVCTVVRAPSLLQSSEVHTYDSIVNQFAGTFVHAAASVAGHACTCFASLYIKCISLTMSLENKLIEFSDLIDDFLSSPCI